MTQETGMSEADIDAKIFAHLSEGEEEVAEEQPSAQPEPVEAQAVETEEATGETEVEEVEAAKSDDQEPGEAEEPAQYTVDDFAEALDMPVDDFLKHFRIDAKVDGQVEALTLGELKQGYQREADYTRKTQQLAEQRKAVEADLAQKDAAFTQYHQQLAHLTQVAEQQLIGSWDAQAMAQLRAEDPGEYSARVQDFQARQQQIEATKQQGMQQWQQREAQREQAQQHVIQSRIQEANTRLAEKLPGWSDPSKREAIQKDTGNYLLSQGYAPKELENLYDDRALTLAHKAMLYDQQATKGKQLSEKVKKLPKVLKPGVKHSKQKQQAAKLNERLARFKKTHSEADLDAILFDRM